MHFWCLMFTLQVVYAWRVGHFSSLNVFLGSQLLGWGSGFNHPCFFCDELKRWNELTLVSQMCCEWVQNHHLARVLAWLGFQVCKWLHISSLVERSKPIRERWSFASSPAASKDRDHGHERFCRERYYWWQKSCTTGFYNKALWNSGAGFLPATVCKQYVLLPICFWKLISNQRAWVDRIFSHTGCVVRLRLFESQRKTKTSHNVEDKCYFFSPGHFFLIQGNIHKPFINKYWTSINTADGRNPAPPAMYNTL